MGTTIVKSVVRNVDNKDTNLLYQVGRKGERRIDEEDRHRIGGNVHENGRPERLAFFKNIGGDERKRLWSVDGDAEATIRALDATYDRND